MPKFTFQWKDPDFCDVKSGKNPTRLLNDSDEEEARTDAMFTLLHNLGIDEYVVVEVDTDAMTTRVVPPRRQL